MNCGYLSQENPNDIHVKSLFDLKQDILSTIIGFERAKRTKTIFRYLSHFFTKEGFFVENEVEIGNYIDPKGRQRTGFIDLRVSHKNINHVIDIEIDSSFRKNSLCKLIKSKKPAIGCGFSNFLLTSKHHNPIMSSYATTSS